MASLEPLSGGCIGEVYRVALDDGRLVVAKTGPACGTLPSEAWMLRYLAARSALPVPEVIAASDTLLLMSHIDGGGPLDAPAQEHAAGLIAALHGVTAERFGLERDTVIGPLAQPNAPTALWVDFLRDRRLMVMGRAAHDAGRMPAETLAALERFCARLGDYVDEPAAPALLHGDLWTGNVLARSGRIAGFVDPAIYYGHPEMDLAFSTMFDTFGEPFFGRYRELRAIAPGFFEVRRDICNLWPLLVHARLFGGGYAAAVAATLRRFGG